MARLILLLILLTALFYLFYFFIKGAFSSRKRRNRQVEPEELVQDPQCQTYVPRAEAVKKRIAGKDYYFCNPECLRKYIEKSKR